MGATFIGFVTLGYLLVLLTYGGGFSAFKSCAKRSIQDDSYVSAPEMPLNKTVGSDEGGIEFQETEAFSRKSTYTSVSVEEAI